MPTHVKSSLPTLLLNYGREHNARLVHACAAPALHYANADADARQDALHFSHPCNQGYRHTEWLSQLHDSMCVILVRVFHCSSWWKVQRKGLKGRVVGAGNKLGTAQRTTHLELNSP
jgi:hypothetical protein